MSELQKAREALQKAMDRNAPKPTIDALASWVKEEKEKMPLQKYTSPLNCVCVIAPPQGGTVEVRGTDAKEIL